MKIKYIALGLIIGAASSIPYILHFGMDPERFVETLGLAFGVGFLTYGLVKKT